MRPGEPILIICHSFPPNSGIGGRRWAKFAKELAHRGYTVHVIRNSTTARVRTSLWTNDVKNPNIIAHPLPDRYPGAMTRWPATTLWDKLGYGLWKRILPLCTKGNWYDRGLFWRKPLLDVAGELISEHGIRNVIVTGAPFSLMAYATELKERFPGIHLVSDFRDMWTWGNYYGYQTIGAKRLRHEQHLEALVARVSDRLISPHPAVIDHLRQAHGVPAERLGVLAHAIDPEDLERPATKVRDGQFKMIYAGSMYGTKEAQHYFTLLLEAFASLKETKPELFAKCRFDLYITDHGTQALEQQVKDKGLEGTVRFHAPLPPKEIMKRIAAADIELAFLPRDKKNTMVTKFAEIFYLGCPILHIGDPGLVSRTITDRRMGDSLRLDELVSELPKIISGERAIEIDLNADHGGNLLANLTDQLVEEVLV
ncbi:MAG: glycosyltransferase [Flavobacteriales bacterium]|nr:glycosyltransferase [Flavobacteriales bacterium]